MAISVITPFREQHTLLQKLLLNHARGREFEERLRLKIMTFDSCQGEERSTIFYSLVATSGQDALNYIFPVSLENAEEAVEEKLKVQRLNVGFSRAQDRIWIMHSQDICLYKGALAQALHYYQRVLERKTPDASQTDPNSPMEAKVLQWLQQSEFVQGQPDEVEIIPQFPIGDYLKQLDPTYEHPAWRVDFLLACRTDKGTLHIRGHTAVHGAAFDGHFSHAATMFFTPKNAGPDQCVPVMFLAIADRLNLHKFDEKLRTQLEGYLVQLGILQGQQVLLPDPERAGQRVLAGDLFE